MSAQPTEDQHAPPGTPGGACIRRWHATRDTRCACCAACRELGLRGKRRLRLTKETGVVFSADRSQEAFAALDRMLAAGRQSLEISLTAGIDHAALNCALLDRRNGGWRRMSGPWAEGLIAAEHSAPAGGRIPVLGTRRRLQALARHGHSVAWLAVDLGVSARTLEKVRSDGGPRTVLVSTADVVRRRFAVLLSVPGDPATAGLAGTRGWAPESAWDDIDDPRERPKGARRHVTKLERIALQRLQREVAAAEESSGELSTGRGDPAASSRTGSTLAAPGQPD